MSTQVKELTSLQAIFNDLKETPYCTGSVPLDVNSSAVFYRASDLDSKAEFVDFYHPTDAQLENLAKACQPATFGMNQQDVYDETYRKAGKMDVGRFSTQFQPANHGIIEVIRDVLLGNGADLASIRVELYKLNVYGPGGFFKAHIDTPRSDDMFGSLVVVLPTVHDGGSLILRKGGNEWTFDSAKAVRCESLEGDPSASQTNPTVPHAAFIAFFSDVEHEVVPVSSGYRVTLTYNLYRKLAFSQGMESSAYSEVETKIKGALDLLLKNPKFFAQGGRLGFGLDHQYAINPKKTKLKNIEQHLKGTDRVIKQICESFSLKVALKAVYRYTEEGGWREPRRKTNLAVLLNRFPSFKDSMFEGDDEMLDYLKHSGGEIVHILGDKAKPQWIDMPSKALPIAWAKPLAETNGFSETYIGHGNEPSLEHVYGEVCLVAKVESAENRFGMDAE